MTVNELIKKLEKFDGNLEVVDFIFGEIEDVVEDTWVDSNYPYNKEDKQVVKII